ncbi:S8 family serine peptidase, partial [Peptococcaceae bacterium]|nr:S8 family serine peptidase [Peptococcaceae bacterium]
FSRRGTLDGRIKPDLVAPGTWILSLADVTNGGEGFSSTNYTYLSGTSMANALATGITAVLRQYFVDIKQIEPSAALVKAALIYGAKDLPNEPRLAQGFGLIDLQASIMSLEDTMTTFLIMYL